MGKRWSIVLSAIAVVAMCAFIFFMSAKPAVESDAMSMGIVDRIVRFFVPDFDQMDAATQLQTAKSIEHVIRKMAHFSEYTLLGLLVTNLVRRIGRPSSTLAGAGVAWAFSTLYAVTDEVHQIFVPGRTFLVGDIFIDSGGVLTGILIFLGVSALVRRSRAHRQP